MTIAKKPIAIGFLFSSVIFLGACGIEEEVTQTVTREAIDYQGPVDANPGGGLEDENIGGKVFGFTEFELEVDYTDQDNALQVVYLEDRDRVEAGYENKMADETLSGNDAFDKMKPLLAELQLDVNMADEEVISQVMEVFSVDQDYESLELEVTYPDGNEKEYETSGS
ncbi:YusW family protein [Planococcus sp. A6]|uniref:YusW family protein n=1 Tax=Planococcus sp. A6 TaxID=2992760 RepID=UPI00237C36B4|nr:YusW family protein [Planococcus sp. A6]MDE0582547.1 YusW family protein [Planococcus sp. A6]